VGVFFGTFSTVLSQRTIPCLFFSLFDNFAPKMAQLHDAVTQAGQ
jgi:hypothetical protein